MIKIFIDREFQAPEYKRLIEWMLEHYQSLHFSSGSWDNRRHFVTDEEKLQVLNFEINDDELGRYPGGWRANFTLYFNDEKTFAKFMLIFGHIGSEEKKPDEIPF